MLGTSTHCIMTLSLTTPSIVTLYHNDSQNNLIICDAAPSVVMLNVVTLSVIAPYRALLNRQINYFRRKNVFIYSFSAALFRLTVVLRTGVLLRCSKLVCWSMPPTFTQA